MRQHPGTATPFFIAKLRFRSETANTGAKPLRAEICGGNLSKSKIWIFLPQIPTLYLPFARPSTVKVP